MFEVGIAAKCCEFKWYVLRLDSMIRELREVSELLSCDKHGCFFPGKCVRTVAKTMVVDKKIEGTNSSMFGIGTGAKCCELKRCAVRVPFRSRTQERESPRFGS